MTCAAVAGVPAAASAAPAVPAAGGAYASMPATIAAVTCRGMCDGIDQVHPGTLLRLKGRAMKQVRTVVFLGAAGAADDVRAPAIRPNAKRVDVRVPEGATTGPVVALNGDGAPSLPSKDVVAFDTSAQDLATAPGGPVAARVTADKIYFDGTRSASLDLLIRGSAAVTVAVQLLRSSDGIVIGNWDLGAVPPNVLKRVSWTGVTEGKVQPEGRYEFRVYSNPPTATASSGTARASQVAAQAPVVTDSFLFLDHQFPIRGAHQYGEGAGRFGAGRDYGGHQGQDVFAKCGTPLVAARGGVVRWKAFHARAGNYVVIDGADTSVDYVYMHLRDEALVDKGERVRTGQPIGFVGDTGRASGCHLHFELWSGAWYGPGRGAPFDPLPQLKAWDAQS
ncbi:MAG: M23 family metallopeptidase [Solirubrobacteraceae bacterium]|nr:M23 family metallopeptidase [Solirubrobacteraceae bacterium]